MTDEDAWRIGPDERLAAERKLARAVLEQRRCTRAWERRHARLRYKRRSLSSSSHWEPSTPSLPTSYSSPSCSWPQPCAPSSCCASARPIVFLLLVALLLALIVLNNPLQALLGIAVVAAALPVYPFVAARRTLLPGSATAG
jgi:hypothetical protein